MQAEDLFIDVRAIVFDFDGTLALTDRLPLPIETFREVAGPSRRDTCRSLIKRLDLGVAWRELAGAVEREYASRIAAGKVPVVESSLRFLDAIPRAKYHVIAASHSPMDIVESLARRAGVDRHVDTILSGDELPRKPDPEIYTAAIDLAAARAWNVVIIESSKDGVTAAVRAGARVVACTNELTRGQDMSAAHVQVGTLESLIPYLLWQDRRKKV